MQQRQQEFQRLGIVSMGMSYDTHQTLAAFARKYDIAYPLLSDEGSRAIRKLGILNTELSPTHKHQGVAFPGWFMVDENGAVTARRFYRDYRVRDTPLNVIADGAASTPAERPGAKSLSRGPVTLTVWLDSPAYRRGQVIGVNAELKMRPGWHIYGGNNPKGYQSLRLNLDDMEGVEVREWRRPNTKPLRIAGLKETFQVYEGAVIVRDELAFMRSRGPVAVRITVDFQACSDRDCLPPEAATFEFELPSQAHAARAEP